LKKYDRQIGSFPQVGMKIQNIENTTQKRVSSVNPADIMVFVSSEKFTMNEKTHHVCYVFFRNPN